MSEPENPPLFYHGYEAGIEKPFTTITLRDLFAAFAMAGALADPEIHAGPNDRANYAYEIADAMLGRRARR